MRKMVCLSCKKYWYVEEAETKRIQVCPYCLETICAEKTMAAVSFQDVLLRTFQEAGREVLKNRRKLTGYLLDIAPDYRKEIRIFSKACTDKFTDLFCTQNRKEANAHEELFEQAKMILLNEEGLSELWADRIVNALNYALEAEEAENVPYEVQMTQGQRTDIESLLNISSYNNAIMKILDIMSHSKTSVGKNKNAALKENCAINILVLGKSNSGKSSLINMLLGVEILPVNMLPTTRLPVKIKYGENKKLSCLLPNGAIKNCKFEDIEKYIVINDIYEAERTQRDRVSSAFEKYEQIEIQYPFSKLKKNISFVDTPGIDTPYMNDARLQKLLSETDVILFCVCGVTGDSPEDKRVLEMITSDGFENPVIIFTYQEVVRKAADEKQLERYLNACYSRYVKYTSRAFCHYIDIRQGVRAKKEQNLQELEGSGCYALEAFLSEYLVNEVGRKKILKCIEESKKCITKEITHVQISDNLLKKGKNSPKAKALNQADMQLDRISFAWQEPGRRSRNEEGE